MLNLYELKKALLYPRTLYMRQKFKDIDSQFIKSALELHYYRPAFFRWMDAVQKEPDLVHEADLTADSIILDAGAYDGKWSIDMVKRYGSTIHAFEPDPRNIGIMTKKIQGIEGVYLHEYGLADEDDIAHMSQAFGGSSIFPDDGPEDAKQVEVKIRDIKSVWDELDLGVVDLMKINIEGAEFPLLERMIEAGLLSSVRCFIIQFHEWHPGAHRRRRAIQKALSKTHNCDWDYHFVWEKWTLKQ